MKLICVVVLLFSNGLLMANTAVRQNIIIQDTVPQKIKVKKIDSTHSPKIAMRRSLMLPGWGQVYNKQWWKVPIVYAGLGITAYNFFYNYNTYQKIRFAYNARFNNDPIAIAQIDEALRGLDISGLALNRRRFRQQVDYSVLFFVAFWGLNVADAVVFAHLKNFDVSDNISGIISVGNSTVANTSGIQLKFDFHKKKIKQKFNF